MKSMITFTEITRMSTY